MVVLVGLVTMSLVLVVYPLWWGYRQRVVASGNNDVT